MIGKECYKEINKLLNQRIEEEKTLIAVHRGMWGGNIVENTVPALKMALRLGGDMVECDLSVSRDGVLYMFHDGHEKRLVGIQENIMTLDSGEIDALVYANSLGLSSGIHPQRVEELFESFTNGELMNIDRAWRGGLKKTLDLMSKYPHILKQAVIKTPVKDEYLEILNDYPVKYMYMPIAYSREEVLHVLSYPNINTVGVEIIARTNQDELYRPETVDWLHSMGLYVWVNTLTMSDQPRHVCYGDLDDNRAVLKDPDEVWGVLMDRGVEILQTDWPVLLKAYREAHQIGRQA